MGSSRGERTPSHWRAGRIIMTSALVLWATCTVVFWWLWGVGFDAADSLRPDPPLMVLYLPTLIIGFVAFAVFFLTLAIQGRPMGTVLRSAGLALVGAAALLYAKAVSRAIAVWISPLGAALAVTGLWALRTGRRPNRMLLVGLCVASVALGVLGLWVLSVALQAQDQAN